MRILRPIASWALLWAVGLAVADGGLKVGVQGGFWSDVQTQLRVNAVVVETAPPLLGYAASTGWTGYAPAAASVARPSGGKSEYLIGRNSGLRASVSAGRIIFTFIGCLTNGTR